MGKIHPIIMAAFDLNSSVEFEGRSKVLFTQVYGREVRISGFNSKIIFLKFTRRLDDGMFVNLEIIAPDSVRVDIAYPINLESHLIKALWIMGIDTRYKERFYKIEVSAHQRIEWNKIRKDILDAN